MISKELGIPRHTVYRRLSSAKVVMRDNSNAARRHSINTRFFNTIDTEDKAYWLGFLAADGNVCGNLVQIDLAVSDKAHLEKFKEALSSSHPVKERVVEYKQARFAVSNRELATDLIRQGITPRKSTTAHAWVGTPELQRHYWRGVVDGDGSIYRSSGKWNIALNGSKSMCESFSVWMKGLVDIRANVTQGHGDIWQVRASGDLCAGRIVLELYGEASVFLERKMKLAAQVMARFSEGDRRIRKQSLIHGHQSSRSGL